MIYTNPNKVIKVALEHYGFDFKIKSNKQKSVEARRMTAAMLQEFTTLSGERIGEMLDYKKTSACRAKARVYEEIAGDERILDDYNSLREKILSCLK